MKGKKLIAIVLVAVLLVSTLCFGASAAKTIEVIQVNTSFTNDYGSRYSKNASDYFADGEITLKDSYIMPDIYNTGYVSDFSDLVDFGVKYPKVEKVQAANGAVLYNITDEAAAEYNYLFEGFKAEKSTFYFVNVSDLSAFLNSKIDWVSGGITHDIVFRDFYIEGGSSTTISGKRNMTQSRLILLDGELENGGEAAISMSNITVKRCYIHGAYVDTVKVFGGQRFESNLITDAGHNGGGTAYGGHPDHFQLTGDDGHGGPVDCENIFIYGNRVDALKTKDNTMNSCILIQPEMGGGLANVQIQKNWFNGGGVPIQIGMKNTCSYYRKVNVSNNYFGSGQSLSEKVKLVSTASMVGNACTFEDNLLCPNVSIGGILYFGDGKVVESLSELASAEDKKVQIGYTNYLNNEFSIRAQLYKVSSDGKITATATSDTIRVPRYIGYSSFSGSTGPYTWNTFTLDMQPTDKKMEVDISSLGEFSDGDELYVSVMRIGTNDPLRSDNLTWDGTKNENQIPGDALQMSARASSVNGLTSMAFSMVHNTSGSVPAILNPIVTLGLAILIRKFVMMFGGRLS